MIKPTTLEGYTDAYTLDCERLLVTLLRGLGPWKNSVYLIGGLTPRYLVKGRPPAVPAHAGTQDVDLVVDLQLLANTEAYLTQTEGYRKDGPVAVAKFELGDDDQDNSRREARILRQRAVTQLIDSLLNKIHASSE